MPPSASLRCLPDHRRIRTGQVPILVAPARQDRRLGDIVALTLTIRGADGGRQDIRRQRRRAPALTARRRAARASPPAPDPRARIRAVPCGQRRSLSYKREPRAYRRKRCPSDSQHRLSRQDGRRDHRRKGVSIVQYTTQAARRRPGRGIAGAAAGRASQSRRRHQHRAAAAALRSRAAPARGFCLGAGLLGVGQRPSPPYLAQGSLRSRAARRALGPGPLGGARRALSLTSRGAGSADTIAPSGSRRRLAGSSVRRRPAAPESGLTASPAALRRRRLLGWQPPPYQVFAPDEPHDDQVDGNEEQQAPARACA